MIRHIPKILVLNLFAISSTINAGAQTAPIISHYAVRIPATSATCQEEANLLGARFAAGTKAKVTGAKCSGIIPITAEGSNYNLYSLLLTYEGAKISPQTVILGGATVSTTPGSGAGIYDTYASCLTDIDHQARNFSHATNLAIIDAFCMAVDSLGQNKYKLQMDGVGTKTNSLYVFDPKLGDYSTPNLQSDIENLVTKSGGMITKVYQGQIFYYAQYALNLSDRMLGLLSNIAECQEQLADAAGIFTGAGAKSLIARCLTQTGSPGASVMLEVIHDGSSSVMEDWGYNNKFYSYKECMGEKARIVEDGGKSTLGGICQPAMDVSTNYVLDLFTTH